MKNCDSCQGKGYLITNGIPRLKIASVERCDQCKRFKGDLTAAMAFMRDKFHSGYSLHDIRIKTP